MVTPAAASTPVRRTTARPYLRTFLGFVGMTDVNFIFAEGLNLGADAQSATLAGAREAIAAA